LGGVVPTGRVNGVERPVVCEASDGRRVWALRIFCWNITHGGANRPPDEFRVQTRRPGSVPFLVGDRTTLVLGYDAGRDVFAAWDAAQHPNPSVSASLQIPRGTLDDAESRGVAAYTRPLASGDVEVVAAFRPEYAADYLRISGLLDATAPAEGRATVDAIQGDAAPIDELPGNLERRRKIVALSVVVRDARFRVRVVAAYGGRCAFCGLGASLVQAAHIVPVHDSGDDRIANGLAACPTHHLAFDRGLIVVGDDHSISLNPGALARSGAAEEDHVVLGEGLNAQLRLPADTSVAPDPAGFAAHRDRWAG